MEVVSLGLLALASSALLTKAKMDSKKKKEAFADTLFGDVPGKKLPPDTQKFITDSASLFNPLAAMLNTSKTSFTANRSIPAYTAPDNATAANLFRSVFTKPSINGSNTIDDNLSEKSATIYRVPKGSILSEAVNLCENMTSKIQKKKADGSLDILADCSVFDKSDFADTCGVCHVNAVNSDGSNISQPQGLYVSSRMRQDPSEEELQRRMLATNDTTNLSQNFVSPTVGSCGSDPKTNKNYFSLSKDICIATNSFLQCKTGQNFSSPGCYACKKNAPGGRSFNFVNSNVGNFSVRQPTTFTLIGKGQVNLRLYDEDGSTPLGYLYNPTSSGFFTLSQTSNNITLSSSSPPPMYKIPLTTSGEAAAGKYLVITLTQPNPANGIPYVQGNFYGNLRDKTTPDKTDFAQTALNITSLGTNITPLSNNSGSFIYYQNGNDGNGMRMQPSINTDIGYQLSNATFKVLIPYLYINTSNIESTYCDGPFIKNENSSALLSNNFCYATGSSPSNYNSNCLSNIFITAGCKVTGSNFPKDAASINRLNAMGDKGDISSNVNSLFFSAYTGLSNGEQMSDTAWLNAQKACFDTAIVGMNPCLNLSEHVKANGPLSDQCIKFLYASGRSNDTTNGGSNDPQTYSTSNAKSLFPAGRVKDRYCTEKGMISPLDGSTNNGSNIAIAKTKGGITALKSFYDNIHKKANQTDMTNSERAQYVLDCYGTTLDVQADSDPTTQNGKDVAATKCGTNGSGLGNIRYVKIFAASGKRLRLSQVVVIDSRGQNVALGKKVTGSPNLISGSHGLIVDGILSLTKGQDRYASNNVRNDGTININTNTYISIDLDGQYDIVQIIVFNTGINIDGQNELAGAKAAIYNDKDEFKIEYVLTSAPIQYIDITGTNPSKSCPQLMNGKRGDLLSGTTNIQNNIDDNITALIGSVMYNRYELGTVGGETGIDSDGYISTSPVAKWIWNHPYASVNSGTTSVSFYITFNNPKTKETIYTLYYSSSRESSSSYSCDIDVKFNNGSFPNATPQKGIIVKAVPGNNYISFTCKPKNGNNPAGFAAFIKDPAGNKIVAGSGTSSDSTGWRCYTSPHIVGAYTYSTGDYTTYNLAIQNILSARSITAMGSTITIYSDNWIWNHPYASINAGSTPVSYYAKVKNSGTTVIRTKFYYNTVNCSVVITVNKKPLTAIARTDTDVDLVPGDNLIYVKCSQSSSYSPAAFAAIISGYIVKWFCDTSPSVDGINLAKTAAGIVYKIYDTPTANWYSDTTYANYVKDDYNPGTLLTGTSSKWIWNQPEGALVAGTTAASFYYDIDGVAGEGVTYKMYFDTKGSITITINGVNYSTAVSGFEFKTFSGKNRISVTVTPSSGSGGFRAYLTNSTEKTVKGSETGGTGWKCDTSTTWTKAKSCDFVGSSLKTTYNCANKLFKDNGCTKDLPVSTYLDPYYQFWRRGVEDTKSILRINFSGKDAASADQIVCRGTTLCPVGYTYDARWNKCYPTQNTSKNFSIFNYIESNNSFRIVYDSGRWVMPEYRIYLARCGNIGTGCGSTNGSSPDGNGNCQGSEGLCRCHGSCGICDCNFGRRESGTTSLATRLNGQKCASGYNQLYDSSQDNIYCYKYEETEYGSNKKSYNKCQDGFTFNSDLNLCEKIVPTVNPNF